MKLIVVLNWQRPRQSFRIRASLVFASVRTSAVWSILLSPFICIVSVSAVWSLLIPVMICIVSVSAVWSVLLYVLICIVSVSGVWSVLLSVLICIVSVSAVWSVCLSFLIFVHGFVSLFVLFCLYRSFFSYCFEIVTKIFHVDSVVVVSVSWMSFLTYSCRVLFLLSMILKSIILLLSLGLMTHVAVVAAVVVVSAGDDIITAVAAASFTYSRSILNAFFVYSLYSYHSQNNLKCSHRSTFITYRTISKCLFAKLQRHVSSNGKIRQEKSWKTTGWNFRKTMIDQMEYILNSVRCQQ